PVLPGAGLHYLTQPIGGVIVLSLRQVDDVTDSHVPYVLRPLMAQHSPTEHLLHPFLPELPLYFLYELQPLSQARRLLKLHLGHFHRGPSQLQMQRGNGSPRLWVARVLSYRSAV
ncbi:MAG: hypothetical protein ACK55Z_07555, partial [bacterium]